MEKSKQGEGLSDHGTMHMTFSSITGGSQDGGSKHNSSMLVGKDKELKDKLLKI